MKQFIDIGSGETRRSIAINIQDGVNPPIIWLCGFLSDMGSVKAEAVAQWAKRNHRRFIRFDYSGHGLTGKDYSLFTISDWLEEVITVIAHVAAEPPILVGSSMGGWLAVLATLRLQEMNPALAPKGLVLLAPAIDFTERLVWDRMPEEARQFLLKNGIFSVPSEYSDTPYLFTRRLIEDGRDNLVGRKTINLNCPVRIIQGIKDKDVPWLHVLRFTEQLVYDPVITTFIPDADHRLSRDQDIASLLQALDNILECPS